MGRNPDGILLLDKGEGESSFGVVKAVKRALRADKVGHAGTLDPFATGLLVILLGQGTKLFPCLTGVDKEYLATLRLGVETDTLDLTGRVVCVRPVPDLEPGLVRERAEELVGEIEQVPPAFSAVHVDGKRAYELARKGVEPALSGRKVWVYRLEVTAVNLPDVTLMLRCSKGTYARSLAAELGRRLGTGGHLRSLRRLSNGPFTVKESFRLATADAPEEIRERIIPLRYALPHVNEVHVDGETARKLRSGVQAKDLGRRFLSHLPEPFEGTVKAVEGNGLVALLRVLNPGGTKEKGYEILRVFA